MKTEVFDDAGRSIRGQQGELVCSASFPSMPLGFWNDADGSRPDMGRFASWAMPR